MFILFESALGFALFRISEAEQIHVKSLTKSIRNYSLFKNQCKMESFLSYKNQEQALECMNKISESLVPDALIDFLRTSLPKLHRKNKNKTNTSNAPQISLGVADANLGNAIKEHFILNAAENANASENTNIDMDDDDDDDAEDTASFAQLLTNLVLVCNDITFELLRGIREYFASYMHDLNASFVQSNVEKSHIGLGHGYSRMKIKYNVNREDNMIIQAICILDQIDKDVNTYCMRCKEWYGWHFPELTKLITDQIMYVKIINAIGDRRNVAMIAKLRDTGMDYNASQMPLITTANLTMTTMYAAAAANSNSNMSVNGTGVDDEDDEKQETIEDGDGDEKEEDDEIDDTSKPGSFASRKTKARNLKERQGRPKSVQGLLVKLREICMDDEELLNAILTAAKTSMGVEVSIIDMISIRVFSTRIMHLAEFRVRLYAYLGNRMGTCAPNLTALMGEQVGARLISKAGSLIKLAKYPASTLQILGAEKALFRALKSKGKCNTPKYGLIYNSTYIMKARDKNKGRISRYLANKASMAVRLDCFLDTPTNKYGIAFRNQVEERLTFFKDGKIPAKNIDVMKKVRMEIEAEQEMDDDDDDNEDEDVDVVAAEPLSKKQKKKQKKQKTKKQKKVIAAKMDVDSSQPMSSLASQEAEEEEEEDDSAAIDIRALELKKQSGSITKAEKKLLKSAKKAAKKAAKLKLKQEKKQQKRKRKRKLTETAPAMTTTAALTEVAPPSKKRKMIGDSADTANAATPAGLDAKALKKQRKRELKKAAKLEKLQRQKKKKTVEVDTTGATATTPALLNKKKKKKKKGKKSKVVL